MIRFIEVTSIQGIKMLINAHKIVSINESVNNQHTYVYFNGDDYIKVKETYKEIKQLIKDVNQDNSKNSKVPEMLEMLKKCHEEFVKLDQKGRYPEGFLVCNGGNGLGEIKRLIKEVTEL